MPVLTPLDVHNKEFRKSFRGYSEEEVDEFLDQVVRDYEEMLREIDRLKTEFGQAEEKIAQFKRIEETLNNTLVVAQSTAEEVKANAKHEADLIIKAAQGEAEKKIAAAREEASRIARDYESTRKEAASFRMKLRGMILAQLEELGREEPGEAARAED
ncbi:MAG TPA: DivIVA domain-containing protein [Bacillota bacterium]|jgi:cell division initiation protein